jgi:hypothetical protein
MSSAVSTDYRDIFLSHSSADKVMVRRIAAAIEEETWNARRMLAWFAEAEIPFGGSIPGHIDKGLSNSRFFAACMSPNYFAGNSGWTDAEWHAALHQDPDNRRGRIVPLLLTDTPVIPPLLRHLKAVDLRGTRFDAGVNELLAVLREQPLPRPASVRGSLIPSDSRASRAILIAERTIPDADPDVSTELLYSNLLPIERLPKFVYSGAIRKTLTTELGTTQPTWLKSAIKQRIRDSYESRSVPEQQRFMPAFRVVGDRLETFHDLEDAESLFADIVDKDDVVPVDVKDEFADPDRARIVVSLINMAISRHLYGAGLIEDSTQLGRFFFAPSDDGGERKIEWVPRARRSVRTVAKPYVRDGKTLYWLHQAARLGVLTLGARSFLKIEPTWVLTSNGRDPIGGARVTKIVNRWTTPERNLQVSYHVRFWIHTLRRKRKGPTITILVGDQTIELATSSAIVQQAYGIAGDLKDMERALDDEVYELEAEVAAQIEDLDAALESDAEDTLIPEFDPDEPVAEDDAPGRHNDRERERFP